MADPARVFVFMDTTKAFHNRSVYVNLGTGTPTLERDGVPISFKYAYDAATLSGRRSEDLVDACLKYGLVPRTARSAHTLYCEASSALTRAEGVEETLHKYIPAVLCVLVAQFIVPPFTELVKYASACRDFDRAEKIRFAAEQRLGRKLLENE